MHDPNFFFFFCFYKIVSKSFFDAEISCVLTSTVKFIRAISCGILALYRINRPKSIGFVSEKYRIVDYRAHLYKMGDKDKKYDRQLRLWGDHGQQALERSRICLINVTATGTETMKNLVLPGEMHQVMVMCL